MGGVWFAQRNIPPLRHASRGPSLVDSALCRNIVHCFIAPILAKNVSAPILSLFQLSHFFHMSALLDDIKPSPFLWGRTSKGSQQQAGHNRRSFGRACRP
jgi:hypothetical protein